MQLVAHGSGQRHALESEDTPHAALCYLVAPTNNAYRQDVSQILWGVPQNIFLNIGRIYRYLCGLILLLVVSPYLREIPLIYLMVRFVSSIIAHIKFERGINMHAISSSVTL